MSAHDANLISAWFAELAERGIDEMLGLVHPEFEMTTNPGQAAEPQTYRGVDGMRLWWEQFYEVMDEVRVVASQVHDAGDGVVVADAEVQARGGVSGVKTAQSIFLLIRLREEKIWRIEFFSSLGEAKAAA